MKDSRDNSIEATSPGRLELAALLIVLGCALGLRVWGLGSFALWEDELYSIDETTELFWSRYEDGIFARPLYFVVANVMTPVLPDTPAGLRTPALLFGMASIAMAWFVARRFAGPWGGLLTAVAISLAPGHLFISTIHRYWSLVFLEALVFAWLAIRADESDRPGAYRAALVAFLVGAATHPLFLAMAAAIGIGSCVSLSPGHLLRLRPPTLRALRELWLPALVLVLAAYAWIALAQGARHVTQVGSASIPIAQRLRIAPAIVFGMTSIVAVGCAVGAWRLRSARSAEARRWAAAVLLGAPMALLALLVVSAFTSVTAIYASALTPLFYVAFGGLLARRSRAEESNRLGPMLLALTVAAMIPSTVSHLVDGGRFDFRPAFEAIRQEDPTLPVVLAPIGQARHYAPDLRSLELPEDGSVDVLVALKEGGTRFWLLLNERRRGIVFDPTGQRLDLANRLCAPWGEYGRTRLDYELYRVRLYLCDPRGAADRRQLGRPGGLGERSVH